MAKLEKHNLNEIQTFEWGEAEWIHEPVDSTYHCVCVGAIRIFPGKHQSEHFHFNEEQVLSVIQGTGIHSEDGIAIAISPTDVIYCPPYSRHEIKNTGKEDLIINIVYVPSRFTTGESISTMMRETKLEQLMSREILDSIRVQLESILTLQVSIFDQDHESLFRTKSNHGFCTFCKNLEQCLHSYDPLYECPYGIVAIEVPIKINGWILGYIRCGHFIVYKDKEIEKKLRILCSEKGIGLEQLQCAYNRIEMVPKSRLYAIEESITSAVQLIQSIAERNYFQAELTQKEYEILKNTKEKLQLKDSLLKANHLLLKEKPHIYMERIEHRASEYPFGLELALENAIKELNLGQAMHIITTYQEKNLVSRVMLIEMVLVLSRTTMRELNNIEEIGILRENYSYKMETTSKEHLWGILLDFSKECIAIKQTMLKQYGSSLIENINAYIQKNFRKEMSLTKIADAFYISPNYLSTLFNEKNKISLTDYIHQLRVAEATTLLKNSNLKICEVGAAVGYGSNSYFISIFKKIKGITPKQYKELDQ